MSEKVSIINKYGERLDALVEGNYEAEKIVVFVHGFGTDKDEGFASFIDLSNDLAHDYMVIRFDQAGYGQSEGEDYEFDFHKAAGDLDAVLRWAEDQYPRKSISICAHSLGTFITSMLSPSGLGSVVFTAIPNANVGHVMDQLQKRIRSKGSEINEDGVTEYPRTRGGVQKIGKDFWRTLWAFDPAKEVTRLARKGPVTIFHPMQDDVLDDLYFDDYKSIAGVQYVELDGDHNFSKLEDRAILFKRIKEVL